VAVASLAFVGVAVGASASTTVAVGANVAVGGTGVWVAGTGVAVGAPWPDVQPARIAPSRIEVNRYTDMRFIFSVSLVFQVIFCYTSSQSPSDVRKPSWSQV
jgi:hypothetical protein